MIVKCPMAQSGIRTTEQTTNLPNPDRRTPKDRATNLPDPGVRSPEILQGRDGATFFNLVFQGRLCGTVKEHAKILLYPKGQLHWPNIEGDMGGRLFTGVGACVGRLFSLGNPGATPAGMERYYYEGFMAERRTPVAQY